MAVDKKLYVNSDLTPVDAIAASGTSLLLVQKSVAIAVADGAGSIYRMAQIPAGYVLIDGEVTCTAITTSDDVNFGLYNTDVNEAGAVIDVDAYLDGVDISSALVPGAGHRLGAATTVATRVMTAREIAANASVDDAAQSYDFALTNVVAATAAGTVVVWALFAYKG